MDVRAAGWFNYLFQNIEQEIFMTDSTQALKKELSKWWWIPLVQGIAAFLLAAALWATPLKTLVAMTYWLGLFWMFDGVLNIIRSFTGSTGQSRVWLFIAGLIGLVAGALLLMHPALASMVSLNLIVALFAVSMLVNGLILIFFGRYAKGSDDRSRSWGSFFIGLLYVLGGVLLMMNPSLTAVTLLYVFMFWAFFVGCSLIWAAFKLKRLGD